MNTGAIDRLIVNLQNALGLAELALDDQQMCVISLGDVSVTLMQRGDSETLYLAAEMAPVEADQKPAMYERLLKMNFLLMDTRGATFAIDHSAQGVFLCQVLETSAMDDNAALQAVGSFLKTSLELQATALSAH